MNKSIGFTLVELLTAIIIIGVLVTVAFFSLISYVQDARETEALTAIRTTFDAQQTHYIELGHFAKNLDELRNTYINSGYYSYEIDSLNSQNETAILAQPKLEDLRGYFGALEAVNKKGQLVFISAICKAKKPGLKSFQKIAVKFKTKKVKCEHSKEVE